MSGSRMAGKRVIVTGGAGGIGAATGELFAAEGASVLLVDRNAEALAGMAASIAKSQPGAEVASFAADITDPAAAAKAVVFAVERLGGLDVLVSNAAVRNLDAIADADLEAWQNVLSVNLLGAVNMCKAALGELRKGGRSSVVIVSSCYATMGRKGFGAYDASKAGLLALTRTLAWEEAEHGIRVNAVLPGGTLTPFTIGRWQARGRTEAELRAETKSDSLLRRWAEPREIAYPILWLASDEASYVTGVSLPVDAGLNVM
jgi:2-hydroxycyclohexanecarboxyl-CoA dehydrogenase